MVCLELIRTMDATGSAFDWNAPGEASSKQHGDLREPPSTYTGYLGAAGNSSSIGSGENDENRPEALTSMRVVVPHG